LSELWFVLMFSVLLLLHLLLPCQNTDRFALFPAVSVTINAAEETRGY
jgi:hypothetical protein